jgi:hypothetical protein
MQLCGSSCDAALFAAAAYACCLLPRQAGEGLQLLDWSVSAKAQLRSWNAYDLVAPRVRVYYRETEKNFKVRGTRQTTSTVHTTHATGTADTMPVYECAGLCVLSGRQGRALLGLAGGIPSHHAGHL